MAPVIFNSRTTSGSLGRTPLDDLMLRPNVHALHPFSANHLHKEGTEKVNYNHLVQSREQREHILYSRINCPGSKCHSGESCNETGEKPQTVEETPGEKRKRKNQMKEQQDQPDSEKDFEQNGIDGAGKLNQYTALPQGVGGGAIIAMRVHVKHFVSSFSLQVLTKCPDAYRKNKEHTFFQ